MKYAKHNTQQTDHKCSYICVYLLPISMIYGFIHLSHCCYFYNVSNGDHILHYDKLTLNFFIENRGSITEHKVKFATLYLDLPTFLYLITCA